MNISPNELRRLTVQTLREINEALEADPRPLGPARAALLQGKAQCLNTLTLLQEPAKTPTTRR